jgi:hypothetical protein
VALLDHMGQQADHDAAVHRVRVPRAVRDGIGEAGSTGWRNTLIF